jgi:hypothetical protein
MTVVDMEKPVDFLITNRHGLIAFYRHKSTLEPLSLISIGMAFSLPDRNILPGYESSPKNSSDDK